MDVLDNSDTSDNSDIKEEEFYYFNKIDDNIVEYLNDILVTKLEDEMPENGFFSSGNLIHKRVRVSTKIKSKTSQKIINIVKLFFDKAGLVVNTNNGYIDYMSYKYNGPKIETECDIEKENVEYFDDVNVCFLITNKDDKLKEGNIDLYESYPSFMQILGYEKEKKTEIFLQTGSVFLMSGNKYYKLNGCSGYGDFNIIRVTLYTKKRTGYQYDNDNDE